MKLFLMVIFCSSMSFSQEQLHVSLYGNGGLGLSRVRYSDGTKGTASNIGITLSKRWVLKYGKSFNSGFSFLFPPDKINAVSYLIGYSFQPYEDEPKIFFVGKIGTGSVEKLTSTKHKPYTYTSDVTRSIVSEIDIEYRINSTIGAYAGLHININNLANIYGITVGFTLGYF